MLVFQVIRRVARAAGLGSNICLKVHMISIKIDERWMLNSGAW